jgi:hypothetical protein
MGAWAFIRKAEIPVIFKGIPNRQHALASGGSLFFAAEDALVNTIHAKSPLAVEWGVALFR